MTAETIAAVFGLRCVSLPIQLLRARDRAARIASQGSLVERVFCTDLAIKRGEPLEGWGGGANRYFFIK